MPRIDKPTGNRRNRAEIEVEVTETTSHSAVLSNGDIVRVDLDSATTDVCFQMTPNGNSYSSFSSMLDRYGLTRNDFNFDPFSRTYIDWIDVS